MSTFKLLGMHHVSVVVSNTEKSLGFYRDLLELTVDHSRPEMQFTGAWLNLGRGQQLHLLEVENPDPINNRPKHGGKDRHFALAVNNLLAVENKLNAVDIPFTKSVSGRSALFCRDPDGNAVEIIEIKA